MSNDWRRSTRATSRIVATGLALVLAALLVLILTGCGQRPDPDGADPRFMPTERQVKIMLKDCEEEHGRPCFVVPYTLEQLIANNKECK